jgi:hypothetical protein
MFKFKFKPKIKLSKLLKDKELEFKSIDTEVKYETELDDDVTFKAGIKADLNYQESNLGLSSVKSAKFSFTKKF